MNKLPHMLAFSLLSDYDEGDSYNWAQWKHFSREMAMGLYTRRTGIPYLSARL